MYEIRTYVEARAQIATLPGAGLVAYGELLDVLQLTPWNGPSANPVNPAGAVRLWTAAGPMVAYLILEDERRVDVIEVVWWNE